MMCPTDDPAFGVFVTLFAVVFDVKDLSPLGLIMGGVAGSGRKVSPYLSYSRLSSPLHLALSRTPGQLPFLGKQSKPLIAQHDEVPRTVRLLVRSGHADSFIESNDGENCYDLISSNSSTWGTDLLVWLFQQTISVQTQVTVIVMDARRS